MKSLFCLFKGRHPLPKNKGELFQSFDFNTFKGVPTSYYAMALNSLSQHKTVNILVTGMTPALTQFLSDAVRIQKGDVILWHFNSNTKQYETQLFSSFCRRRVGTECRETGEELTDLGMKTRWEVARLLQEEDKKGQFGLVDFSSIYGSYYLKDLFNLDGTDKIDGQQKIYKYQAMVRTKDGEQRPETMYAPSMQIAKSQIPFDPEFDYEVQWVSFVQ